MLPNDDPFVWFYYIYGFAVLPLITLLWLYHRRAAVQARLAPRVA